MTPFETTPDRLLVDRIDALTDEDPLLEPPEDEPERCPHCIDEWHALPIRRNLPLLRTDYSDSPEYQRRFDAYDHHTDTSAIVCPGSTIEGPVQPLTIRAARAGFDVVHVIPIYIVDPADPYPEPEPQTRPPAPRSDP